MRLLAKIAALWFLGQTAMFGIYGDTWAYEGFINEIKNTVPPDARIYMEDLSGRLAILSGRTFISGDGLVNSNDYLSRYLMLGRVDRYLRDKQIHYFLSSNIQCEPYRKRMPWTRDIEMSGDSYRFIIDISYLTRLPLIPSILYIPKENLIFDRCINGIRELLFKINP